MPTDDVPAAFTAPAAENPHAGQGQAVVLDIGGDIGAVVLTVPEDLVGREIEIVPEGSRGPGGRYEHAAAADHAHAHAHPHDHEHEHEHEHDEHDEHDHDDHGHDHPHDDHGHDHPHGDHGHDHPHGDHGHDHGPEHPPHVGVVARPLGNRLVPSAVFGDVVQGRYELSLRPHERVALVVDVRGGEVTEAVWPSTTTD